MKKRILSSLLMGALFVASMSTFTSCKDYDDDINKLTGSIDKAALASDVTALQTTVNTATTNAATALKTAQDAATAASTNALAITAVKATADQAAKDVATAITNAATAQTTAEAAAKAAATAQDSANAAIKAAAKAQAAATSAASDATKALEQIGNIEKNYVTSTTLADKLASLKAEILADTTSEATLAKLSAQVTSYKGSINYLYSAVTSVELFATYMGAGITQLQSLPYNTVGGMTMLHGSVATDSKFGDNEAYSASSPIISFVKGQDIKDFGGVIVRVNPTNVDLTNSKIVLINSKGEVLDKVVAGVPVKYNELITRSTTINSGLWKIPFNIASGVTAADFKKAVMSGTSYVLYAVAINNTTADTTSTVAANRYVASTWDVSPRYQEYAPTSSFSFKVGTTDVEAIHNRWNGTKTVAEDGTTSDKVNELKWAVSSTANPTPATAATDKNTTNAADSVEDDARYSVAPLAVEVNTAFDIKLSTNSDKIQYYYVTLDKDRALESAPSEWNAWSSYSYEGLFKTTSADSTLSLKMTSDKANGDIIGFRVYAVNYDGTLVDPDGRAFYVQVGQAQNSETVKANILAEEASNGAVSGAFALTVKNSTIVALNKAYSASTDNLAGKLTLDAASAALVNGASVYYRLLQSDKKTAATDWSEAKYIAVTIDQPGKVVDGSTLKGTITASVTKAGYSYTANTLNVEVTKTLPSTLPSDLGFSWKANQLTGDTYICYVDPTSGAWNTASTTGSKDFTQAVNGLDKNKGLYEWSIANASDATKAGTYADALTATNNGTNNASTVTVNKSLIDNKTTHATTLTYLYKGLSCTKDSKGNFTTADKKITVGSGNVIFACALAPSVQTYAWVPTTVSKVDYKDYAISYHSGDITCNSGATKITVDLSTLITGSNAYYKTTADGTGTVLTGVFAASNYIAGFTATLTSDSNSSADYFDVAFTGSAFTFTQKSGATTPTSDVASHLNIKATDAFGHTETIISLPLTVRAQ